MKIWRLFVPKQAVGASLIYFDLFNAANSGWLMDILSCQPVNSGAVAVTGVVGLDLFLQRTSAIGTGGTAATYNGTDPTACTISAHNHSDGLPPGITARLTPTGGATAGAVLSWCSIFTEETNAGAYTPAVDLARNRYDDIPPVLVRQGSGISVVQGAVASVGNVGFCVVFALRAAP